MDFVHSLIQLIGVHSDSISSSSRSGVEGDTAALYRRRTLLNDDEAGGGGKRAAQATPHVLGVGLGIFLLAFFA
jgi:hypothetical protein